MSKNNLGEKRDRQTGQYVHTNDSMCTCGHTLGLHAAATVGGERPCFAGDYEEHAFCECRKFRKIRNGKPMTKETGRS